MDKEIQRRLGWMQAFDQAAGNYSAACLKCGISRPTLRKWVSRYREQGVAGLTSKSRRPSRTAAAKISEQARTWIVELRARRLGSRRIQSELKRSHGFEVSRPTIEKVLKALTPRSPLARALPRKGKKRYAKEIPGERVQLDTCQIGPKLYQYTAVDDCTRIRVLAVFPRRTAANSLRFLELMIEEFPFPIQRIQTDRGREFFAYCFQERLMDYGIKFRPVKPASPHLNGKVERSQRTDLEEFYPTVDLAAPDLSARLRDWQDHYNQHRVHGSLGGRTPWEVWYERAHKTPLFEEVEAEYDQSVERLRHADYRTDLLLRDKKQQGIGNQSVRGSAPYPEI